MKPYETVEELLEASKIHGPYVKRSFGRYSLITSIYKKEENTWLCVLGGHNKGALTHQEFLTECTWQDGHLCGKSIEV